MFAAVSLLNEISSQMVAPLIPILIAGVLAAGPIAIGAVEGVADALASLLKLWSGRHADVRPQRRKAMVFIGYALALASRPLIGLAGNWGTIVVLRSADSGRSSIASLIPRQHPPQHLIATLEVVPQAVKRVQQRETEKALA